MVRKKARVELQARIFGFARHYLTLDLRLVWGRWTFGVQMPAGPGRNRAGQSALDGKEAAYVYHYADRYDRARYRDHGYHPREAEVTSCTGKTADRKTGPRPLFQNTSGERRF